MPSINYENGLAGAPGRLHRMDVDGHDVLDVPSAAVGEVEPGPLKQRPYSTSFGRAIQARVGRRQPEPLL